MKSVVDKLTYENYEELAKNIAEEFFPVGTVVWYSYINVPEFGIVKSISPGGKLTIQKGEIPIKKVTDNKGTGGTYAKYWYKIDKSKFIPYTKNSKEVVHGYQTPTTRFSPRCYLGKDWKKRGSDSPIEWTQDKDRYMLILCKPKPNKEGLVSYDSYSD